MRPSSHVRWTKPPLIIRRAAARSRPAPLDRGELDVTPAERDVLQAQAYGEISVGLPYREAFISAASAAAPVFVRIETN